MEDLEPQLPGMHERHSTLDDMVRKKVHKPPILEDLERLLVDGIETLAPTLSQPAPESEPKNAKQAVEVPNFIPIPLSNFAGNQMVPFPTTGETMKATSKVMMNPGYNLMPYPVCFVQMPHYQPRYFYPMMAPMHPQQSGGNHASRIDSDFIRNGRKF
jgi:hypothetical protein